MTQHLSPHLEHNKQPPAEWGPLLALTEPAVDANAPADGRLMPAIRVWNTLVEMSNETKEACLYYGLSRTALAFGETVKADKGRALTAHTANTLVKGHEAYCQKASVDPTVGLYLLELLGFPPPFGLAKATAKNYAAEPAAGRVVTDMLLHQQRTVRRKNSPEIPSFVLILDALKGRQAVIHTIGETFSATSSLLLSALVKGQNPDASGPPALNSLLSDYAAPGTLGDRVPHSVQLKASRMRTDEFLTMGDDATGIRVDQQGRLDPRSLHIPKDPGPIQENDEGEPMGPHIARLNCPARYVRGLIPLIADRLPEATERAQRILLSTGPRRFIGQLFLQAQAR